MSKTSRDKGKRYELEVVQALRPYWPDAKRNLAQFQAIDGRDFDNTEPFCIQAKRRKKIGITEINIGYAEAENSIDARYDIPMTLTRSDNEETMAHLKLQHLIEVLCLMEDGEL